MDETAREPVLVDLALQGGGSHGAFTWGVLDRLIEEPWLKIEAISGTSAGAMNAAVLADGWTQGGAEGARAALDAYWQRVSRAAAFSPLQRSPLDRLMGRWTLDTSPAYLAMDIMTRMRLALRSQSARRQSVALPPDESIDFDRLATAPIKLFITATNVRTGRGRIFRNKDITADVLLASACLPTMFQAIEIDGEPYWDGGYSGNPTLTPLVRESDAHDTILVQINPRERPEAPRSANEILNRLNEISFNSPLMKELRMIALLRQVADPGHGEGARWAGMRTHRIMTDKLAEFGASSKLNAEWEFVTLLKAEGGSSAEEFLDAARRRSRQAFHHRSRRAVGGDAEIMKVAGFIGILLGLGLLIAFAFRGWSVLLLAPLAALIAALFSREPLLAHWTQTFMGSAAGFLAQFFPLFLLGALFGKLMEDSGSVTAIADFMTRGSARGGPCWPWCSPARLSPMAASACSSPSSCWCRWRRSCSVLPASRGA